MKIVPRPSAPPATLANTGVPAWLQASTAFALLAVGTCMTWLARRRAS